MIHIQLNSYQYWLRHTHAEKLVFFIYSYPGLDVQVLLHLMYCHNTG